ncbi:MAG TPA: hypothetical protein DEQ09_11855, partial [Bacteroidales bacterium]|nr:hypothetical protein [Bacteroidales bacterium]
GAFITADGWGSFMQKREQGKQYNEIEIVYGQLVLNKLEIRINKGSSISSILINGKEKRNYKYYKDSGLLIIDLDNYIINEGEKQTIICNL